MADDGFKKTLMAAFGWSVALKFSLQVLSWALTLLVIRILQPDDYGLMALSQVFTNFMLAFSNLGLGNALVQKQAMPKSQTASVFGVLILLGLVLAACLSLAAYPIATWYDDDRLVRLIQVSSLGFVFNALSVLPRAALTRQMSIRPLVVCEVSSGLISSFVVILLALNGFGVWALMLGWIVGNVVKQIAFMIVAPWSFVVPQFHFAELRPLMSYGLYTTGETVAFTVMASVDVLIVGRLLGPGGLGLYTVILNFAALPLSKIAPIVNTVAFPAFAMIQHRASEARFYVLKGMRLLALATVPIFLGMGATAPEIVAAVFGPAWLAAIPLLPILSAALVFRALLIPSPSFLMGIGDSKGAFLCTAVGAVLLPTAVLVGCFWGIQGVCYAWLVCYPVIFVLNAAILSRRGGLPLRELLMVPVGPAVAGLLMVAAVTAVRPWLPPGLEAFGRLLVLVPVGAVAFGAVLAVGFPSLLAELIRLARRKNAPVAAAEPHQG